MIKFEKIKPGMVLYDRHRTNMGNTMLRSLSEWEVRVFEVDAEKRTAIVSWNGNAREVYYDRDLEKLHTWSMYDASVAVIYKGMWSCVLRCRKLTKAELLERKIASDRALTAASKSKVQHG